MESLKGSIVETIFRNDENGYTVALLETADEVITLTGTFAGDISGESIEVFGKRVKHPKYGEQFQVEMYTTLLPTGLDQIENYLSSGLIKGVGKHTAKKIVEAFKEDTFDIIQKTPEKLTLVEGIGEKKAQMIAKSFQDQADLKEIMMFLQNHNISTNYSIKIYKEYGKNTINVIKDNPYRLAEDIYGIGFKLADKIASSLGVEKDSPYRISSGVKYVLLEYALRGHTYDPYKSLVKATGDLLETSIENIEDEIRNMAFTDKIHIETLDSEPVAYYLPYHTAEVNVCKKLINLASIDPVISEEEVLKCLEADEDKTISLTDMQKEAVVQAVINGVTVITGGPGTGKTTIILSIIKIFERMNEKVLLCAPTGRAAKRITESTGREAKTIHRLLGVNFTQGYMAFERNESAPIDADVIILDETSMIDVLLMSNFLAAVRPGTRLVLVGDVDQLPSVGPGSLLKDVIASGVAEVVRLTEIFRQAQLSMIVTNAHRVNRGTMPIFNKNLVEGADADFFFIREEDPEKVTELVTELVAWRLPRYLKCNPIDDIQGMAPMRRTVTGVDNLNLLLREALNPKGRGRQETRMGAFILREGDKVMQIRNNYDKMVFNGDIGRVVKIDPEEQEVVVAFDESDGLRRVAYEQHELDELVLSYAISVHKSQGSEYPVVVMPITTQHYVMLQRNLLYTAITRAKRMVVLVGTLKALAIAVKNDTQDTRFSGLSERLVCAASEDP